MRYGPKNSQKFIGFFTESTIILHYIELTHSKMLEYALPSTVNLYKKIERNQFVRYDISLKNEKREFCL